ncbi:MAG TPA: Rap1a/Tai family immunity protein [Terriglobales bacterium]
MSSPNPTPLRCATPVTTTYASAERPPRGQASPNAAACGIWLTGVMDGLQAYNTNMKALPLFDAPNLAVGPVAKLLVNYVTSHPQQASLPTSALVLGALVEAYPRKEASATPKN